jgi:outer membrane cobalamin receptor
VIGHENTKTRNKPCCTGVVLSCFRGYSPPACVAARLWPIAAFICLAVAPLRAQLSAGELRVSVVDATGLGLAAAGTLVSDGSQTDRRFETAADGRFTFDRLPFGIYRLTLSSPGFATRTELIEVRSPRPREVRLVLDVAALSTSVDVTEQSTLVDAHRTGVAYGVGTQQLREQQSAVPGRELLDLVNLQPGWLVESNGVLHPRGSEYQTLVVVDGMPMEDNRSPAFAPELPDAEIEAVNVITGTFPAEYGRKLGGVVDVTTSKDVRRGFHGSAEMGAGSFGTGTAFASGGYGWNRRALMVSAGTSRTDRYLDPPTTSNASNSGTLGGVSVSFDQHATARDRIQAGWRHSQASFQVPDDLEQEAAGQRQDRSTREHSGQVAWSHVFSPRLLLNVRAAGTHLSADLWSNAQAVPVAVFQQRGFARGYTNASLSAEAGRHEIKIGGDLLFTPVHEALQYHITDASFFDPQTPVDFTFADRQSDREQALFAQDTIRLGNLTASAGLRWDRYAFVVDDSAFSPRLGIAWYWPAADLVLRASYDRAFQTPAMENLLLASSSQLDSLNPELLRIAVPPSRGNYVEAGVSVAIAKSARLDATAYRRTFRNYADDDVFLNTGISFPIAFEGAAIRGLDLKLTLPRWRGVTAFAAYSNLRGHAELPVAGGLFLGSDAAGALDATDRIPVTQDQRHTARARVRYQVHSRAWTAALVKYGSGLPVELEEDVALEELAAHYGQAIVDRVDVARERLRQTFAIDWAAGVELWRRDRRRLEMRAELANLMDRLNVVNFAGLFSGTALAPPRSASVRLRLDF